jgi:hypothetical protein
MTAMSRWFTFVASVALAALAASCGEQRSAAPAPPKAAIQPARTTPTATVVAPPFEYTKIEPINPEAFKAAAHPPRPMFFSISSPPVIHKLVYVVDRSGSMTDSIDHVKLELKRSIDELAEEDEFHVIFYSSGPPVEMPTRRLVPATDANKKLAAEFIDGIVAQGETEPSKAIERAFAVGPDLIYLMTDGEFDRAIIPLVKRLNPAGKVTVHCIGFIYETGEAVLKEIAAQNGGQYKFVTDVDLEKLNK